MKYYVYYLFSESLNKYYIGKTDNLERRIEEHNRGAEIYTSRGKPWKLYGYVECQDNKEAIRLELKLKKAKNPKYVRWYIENNGNLSSLNK